jgi:hypothetical protein
VAEDDAGFGRFHREPSFFDFVALLPALSPLVRWTLSFLRHPCSDVG